MKAVRENSTDIRHVELNGLTLAEGLERKETDFSLIFSLDNPESTDVQLMIYTGIVDQEYVEFEECLRLEDIPPAAVSSAVVTDMYQSIMFDPAYFISRLFATFAAASAKLEIIGEQNGDCGIPYEDSITFVLTIGPYVATTTVDASKLRHIFTLNPSSEEGVDCDELDRAS